MNENWQSQLAADGHLLVGNVFSTAELDELLPQLMTAIEQAAAGSDGSPSPSIRGRSGRVYAARNILSIFPAAVQLWQREPLMTLLRETLGEKFGLVRGLYFDKHPEKSWSLPWHKDLSIAVKRNDLPTEQFKNPTTKSGVDHVEASQELLESMLTLRIHLDEITEDNGPLMVMPGSHNNGKVDADAAGEFVKVTSGAGDVLVMRPLLTHSSGTSTAGTTRHRRILHLEFAAEQQLPDRFEWHFFQPPGAADTTPDS